VPSVFVILQRLEEWRDRRKAQRAKDTKPYSPEPSTLA
jgi:hypothetical protein